MKKPKKIIKVVNNFNNFRNSRGVKSLKNNIRRVGFWSVGRDLNSLENKDFEIEENSISINQFPRNICTFRNRKKIYFYAVNKITKASEPQEYLRNQEKPDSPKFEISELQEIIKKKLQSQKEELHELMNKISEKQIVSEDLMSDQYQDEYFMNKVTKNEEVYRRRLINRMQTMNDWDIINEQLKYLEIFKFPLKEDFSELKNFKNPDCCNKLYTINEKRKGESTCRTYKKYLNTCNRYTC